MYRPLTESDLFPRGPLRRLGRRVELFAELDSTNTYLLTHAAHREDGTVVAAEFQTAGRGRQRRRWRAPRGSSILLSVLLIEPEGAPLLAHVGTLAALAAVEAIESETDCHAELRWPNDLVVGGRKLGGVLVESTPLLSGTGDSPAQRALVVGVGLNCFQQRGHFAAELEATATSLELECAQPVDRPAVARRLIERLDEHVSRDSGEACLHERLRAAWTDRCHDLGGRVTLVESSETYTGTVLEIVDNGDLLVQLDSGVRRRFESTTTSRIA